MAVSRRLRFEILRRDGHTCRYCGAMAPNVELDIDHVIPTTLGGTDDPSNLVTSCKPCNGGKSSVPADAPLVADVAADALRWKQAIEWAASEYAVERQIVHMQLDEFEEAWKRWSYPVEIEVPAEPVDTGDPIRDNWRRLLGWPASSSAPVAIVDGLLIVNCEKGYKRDTKTAVAKALPKLAELAGRPLIGFTVEYGPFDPIPPTPQPTYREERRRHPLDNNWRESVTRFLSLGLTPDVLIHFVDLSMRQRKVAKDETFRYFCGCCWRHITDLQESARRLLESEEAEGE